MRGAILAGGASSRLGGVPKGLLEVAGIRILDRVVVALVEAFGELPLLVANAADAASWRPDLETVPDRRAGAALGGIFTAVAAAPGPVVVVAWDMPFVTAPLLRRLADALINVDVALPASGPRGLEPLCAAYGPTTLEPIRRAIGRGDFRAVAFHDEVRVAVLGSEEVARFGDPARLFFNVNTAADLAAADLLAKQERR